jgi:murein L,D-transpeptidase YcbB/YkuD
MRNAFYNLTLITAVLTAFLWSCQSNTQKEQQSKEAALALERNAEVNREIQIHITDFSREANSSYSYLNTTTFLYENRSYLPFWSDTGKASKFTLSFLNFLDTCEYTGLVKEDFNVKEIHELWKGLQYDSNSKKQFKKWSRFDVLLSNAFFNVCNDLKRGRLYPDSTAWVNDTAKYRSFFIPLIDSFALSSNCNIFFNSLQPQWSEYKSLRNELKIFLKNKDTTKYTFIDSKLLKISLKDSLKFYNNLFKRLYQESLMDTLFDFQTLPDSISIAQSISVWQKKYDLVVDGKLSDDFIKAINLTDHYKYIRLLLTLDRYKLLPDSMGATYISVNLPAFELKVWDNDTVALYSKVICGKPISPTPQLSSAIREIVTMPTWTVPTSIIKKEMLPQLKKNPFYLSKKGLSLYDNNGKKLDPSAVDWTKYKKGIPYKIRQKSGTGNALGVIKFNFANDHDVYLHDTNERYLFQRKKRALSHGCVRVEKWMELATLIAQKDSLQCTPDVKLKYNADSIANYIANHKNQRIGIKYPIPIFINYFSVASVDGKLFFYNDIYNDDERLINNYFSSLKLQK